VILQEAVDLLAERTWTSATIRAGPVRGAPPMAQPMAEPIRDLFDLPEQIRKGDFVHKLSEGVEHARETASSYVVTPAIAGAFDRALGLVAGSLRDGTSQAAYVHGSFGSGKSHFMALLSLLLEGNEDVWRIAELHALRGKHGFVGKAKLLQLRLHMIDKAGLEEAIFGGYVEHVRRVHPAAPVPALFGDAALFDDAATMLSRIGEETFFAPLNAAGEIVAEGWGEYATRWDRARFDEVVRSSDGRAREELFSALVKAWFPSYTTTGRWTGLDEGLGVLTRHAKRLGYDGVVLFLDELILWLAGRAADVAWLHRETQKMVKLVEAQDAHREIALVSFIARQRDLADMVGEDYVGTDSFRLREFLKHWEGRYDVIELEDRNLPAIVEKRVLRPASPEAKRKLDDAFAQLRKGAGVAWTTLAGSEDAEAFRKLYPFSPALVETLVALSNSLQRQRTAIKLLMELLVHHSEGLELGEVMRVGDLFDVLASGDDPADGVMRTRFASAKTLYQHTFLPLIRQRNGTASPEKCQRLRDDHLAWKGCSGCAQRACRSDNRMVKTLLLAELVPQVAPLRDLTASRLVQLNHGSLKVPVQGTEAGIAVTRLRDWASAVGQLRVGEGTDPTVKVRLEGVDVAPILEQARGADSTGARMRLVRDLLFEAMGVDATTDSGREHRVEWRETWRRGFIRFANVRKLGTEELRCPDDHAWRLVVDYPFDDAGFGPHDDERVLDDFVGKTAGSWTLVWLPTFFSKAINDLLGELVVLDHVLESTESRRRYLADLSVEQQSRAQNDLESLRTQKRNRIRAVLEQAYGLRVEQPGDLDGGLRVEQHLRLLQPGATIHATVAANLASALESYVPALLESRFPKHPRFTKKLTTRQTVEQLVARFGQLVDSADKRLVAERREIDDVRGTLVEIGLARVTESAIHLVEDRLLQDLDNRRKQQGLERPTVGQMRALIDPSGLMGLEPEAEDLVARCYARWSARTFVHFGRAYTPQAGATIPGDVELEKPDLPTPATWETALGNASKTLGIALPGRALHADNLKLFETKVREEVGRVSGGAKVLPEVIEHWLETLEIALDVDRARTARSGSVYVARLETLRARLLVDAIAEFPAETSEIALGRSLGSAEAVRRELQNQLALDLFAGLRGRADAAKLLTDLEALLRQDETNAPLVDRLPRPGAARSRAESTGGPGRRWRNGGRWRNGRRRRERWWNGRWRLGRRWLKRRRLGRRWRNHERRRSRAASDGLGL
jgi:hypothetical protein